VLFIFQRNEEVSEQPVAHRSLSFLIIFLTLCDSAGFFFCLHSIHPPCPLLSHADGLSMGPLFFRDNSPFVGNLWRPPPSRVICANDFVGTEFFFVKLFHSGEGPPPAVGEKVFGTGSFLVSTEILLIGGPFFSHNDPFFCKELEILFLPKFIPSPTIPGKL